MDHLVTEHFRGVAWRLADLATRRPTYVLDHVRLYGRRGCGAP